MSVVSNICKTHKGLPNLEVEYERHAISEIDTTVIMLLSYRGVRGAPVVSDGPTLSTALHSTV